MRVGFLIGAFFVISGVWMRTLMQIDNPLFCLMGSILSAIGSIFVFNSPVKMAVNWFKSSTVPKIIFLAVISNLLSVTIGASVPGLILKEDSTPDEIIYFLRLEAIVVSVPFIILLIFIR
jgi:hypothetical protein